jgi:formate hydrogenlyase subunit 4
MNGVLAFIVALLLYPGIVAGVAAAWILTWTRDVTRATLASGSRPHPLAALFEIRAAFGRDILSPSRVHSAVLGVVPAAAAAVAVAALVLLPVPGNPLVGTLGLSGDLAAEGALLLAVPFARLLIGWATPSPYTRLAADRGARMLAGAVVPMTLAVAAIAQQAGALRITVLDTLPGRPLTAVALAARVLAACAFACCLPVIARATALREADRDPELAAGELTESSGRDLGIFRLAEGLQLAAACAFFAAAFVLPVLANSPSSLRAVAWVAAPLLTAAGIGGWEGVRRAPRAQADQPPLSWWFGLPILLALAALVAAAFAARGA